MSELIYDVIFLVFLFVAAVYSTVSFIFLKTGSKKLLKENNRSNGKMIKEINRIDNFFEKDGEKEFVTDNEYLSARAKVSSLKALGYSVFFIAGFVGMFIQSINKFHNGEYRDVVHQVTPLDETTLIWSVVFGLLGLFWFCSGIFLLVKSNELLKRDIPREKDMLFEAVQKLTFILYLKNVGTQKFIEDKETLAKTAKQNGIAGIVTGGTVIFAVIYFVVKCKL